MIISQRSMIIPGIISMIVFTMIMPDLTTVDMIIFEFQRSTRPGRDQQCCGALLRTDDPPSTIPQHRVHSVPGRVHRRRHALELAQRHQRVL